MKILLVCFPFILSCVSCGDKIPVDGGNPWDSNNRLAVEQINDCNTVTHSVGLSGCAVKEGQVNGNLTLPHLWTGDVFFESYNCDNFTLAANSTTDNVLKLNKLYTAQDKMSCSFKIVRTIREGTFTSDRTMLGRFMIKIIPTNKYWTALNFAVNAKVFKGVGWFQRDALKADAVLTITPKAKEGMLTITCGDIIVKQEEFKTTPIKVALDSFISCDYEMQVASYTSPDVEIASYMHEVNSHTVSITPPIMWTKKTNIYATFNDLDIKGKDPVVYAAQIDNTKCLQTNQCRVPNNKTSYVVKGLTSNLSFFYGVYDTKTKAWEIE